ncbi:glycosyltransferase family 2 protein [Oleidesulfovibrio sp.]|uniref:glycosyltransferase family 2 protein n=1 Tax=Oleidesulfovibrio sp. TaxID=2909707 RepID=UPI003A868242
MIPVSVIIPTYNRKKTLFPAIHSVLSQSAPAVEIIVVDDGSVDGTAQAFQAAGLPDNVLYIRQENAGAGAARNRGLQEASGEWVAFLDSDDIWRSDKLKHFVEELERTPDMDFYYHASSYAVDAPVALSLPAQTLASRRNRLDLLAGFYSRTPTVMVRMQLLKDWGLQFGTKKTCEDYYLFWRAVAVAKHIGYSPAIDTITMFADNSITKSADFSRIVADQFDTIKAVIGWMCDKELESELIEQMQWLARWQYKNLLSYLLLSGRMFQFFEGLFRPPLNLGGTIWLKTVVRAVLDCSVSEKRDWIRRYATR